MHTNNLCAIVLFEVVVYAYVVVRLVVENGFDVFVERVILVQRLVVYVTTLTVQRGVYIRQVFQFYFGLTTLVQILNVEHIVLLAFNVLKVFATYKTNVVYFE